MHPNRNSGPPSLFLSPRQYKHMKFPPIFIIAGVCIAIGAVAGFVMLNDDPDEPEPDPVEVRYTMKAVMALTPERIVDIHLLDDVEDKDSIVLIRVFSETSFGTYHLDWRGNYATFRNTQGGPIPSGTALPVDDLHLEAPGYRFILTEP